MRKLFTCCSLLFICFLNISAQNNIRDPFAWQKFEGLTKYGRIDGDFLSRPDIGQVTATFTCRFGQNEQQNQPRCRNSSSQEEQNRVGQGGQ